jgi:hypothetical protein
MAPYIQPMNEYTFLPHLPSWRDLVKDRLNESIERYVFQFSYLDDYQINDELISRVLGKMNLSSQERHELFAQHQERHSLTSSGHDRNLLSSSVFPSTLPSAGGTGNNSTHTGSGQKDELGLFAPIRITIRLEFYSLLDYLEYNQAWMASNWSVYHVAAFLRLTNQRELEDLFVEKNIDGKALFQLAQPIELIPFPKIKEVLLKVNFTEEAGRVFRGKVLKLGCIDHLELLQEVMQEECRVRAEYERKSELAMATAKSQYRQQQGIKPTPVTPSTSAPSAALPSTPQAPSASTVSTPATTVYKFSHLAAHSSSSPSSTSKKTGTSSATPQSPQTPTIHYANEEKDEIKRSTQRGGEREEAIKETRVTRGDTLFSDGLFEVVMVGEGAVGKTSVLNRICQDQFHAVEKPTIGTRLMQHALGKLVLDIWDTGGQPAQYATMKARAKRADVILAIYDVSNRDSLIALKTILQDLFQLGMTD